MDLLAQKGGGVGGSRAAAPRWAKARGNLLILKGFFERRIFMAYIHMQIANIRGALPCGRSSRAAGDPPVREILPCGGGAHGSASASSCRRRRVLSFRYTKLSCVVVVPKGMTWVKCPPKN